MDNWLLASVLIAAGLLVTTVVINRRRVRAWDRQGDPAHGIVVFVEPVRWLFVIWGFVPFCRGLRRAGGGHQVKLFRWCTTAGALLVVPDLVRKARLQRKAVRLARVIDNLAMMNPEQRIHLVGYSSGCYLALEACKHLLNSESLGAVVLMAGSISPRYRWEDLRGRLRHVHSFHSAADLITAIGPTLFGSNDHHWGPACGTVGFAGAPPFVEQRSWRLTDVLLGYFGDHFTIVSPAFVARNIAPILIGREAPDRPRTQAHTIDGPVLT